MTISKISKGKGFRGLIEYLLDEDKNARIISGCMFGSTPTELAREFRLVANLRRSISKPVRHFSISFAPEDKAVDDVTKEAIVFRVLDGLGYENCQFLAIDHSRDDPGHDRVHSHDHLHIVTNAVTVSGKYVRDSFDYFKIQPILREAERDFGLRQIDSSWEVKKRKAESVDRDLEISKTIATTLKDRPNLLTWLERLETENINVRFNLTHRDNVAGITFLQNEQNYKGCDIGHKWSQVGDRLTLDPGDLTLMKAVNERTQAKSVQLNKLDRAMFDRVVEMAVMKLDNTKKFKNSRVELTLDEDVLSIIRIRPNKLMLRAIHNDGRWEAIGFPNVEGKDVSLLERMNKVESLNFEADINYDSELEKVTTHKVVKKGLRRIVPVSSIPDRQEQNEMVVQEGMSI